jgi:hypothetical protein
VRTVRRRLVVAAAFLFALALGVALGSGPLSQPERILPGMDKAPAGSDAATTAFENAYIDKTGGDVLNGRLKGHSVVILTAEGAVPSQVDVVASGLKQSGADVVGRVQLTTKLTDPANRQFVDGVARQSALKVKSVADGDGSYDRVGAALVRALIGKVGDSPDSMASTIWSAFDEGGLVSGDDPGDYADTVVLVVGPDRKASVSTVVAELARAIDDGTKGTVLAGPSASSLTGGAVAELREDGDDVKVSTVDVTNSAAGGVVVARALDRATDDKPGAWGTPRSDDGALP